MDRRDCQAAVTPAPRALRHFAAKDRSGQPIWPPNNATNPLPGPTLRASVGERVELTFLNHIDIRDFACTGIDRDGCDRLFVGTPDRRSSIPAGPETALPTVSTDRAPSTCISMARM